MSLFGNLLDTYEKCRDAVGIKNDTGSESDEKKTLLPVFHMTSKSQICITLDSHGRFVDAKRDNDDITIIIPCTEDSAGRANTIAPHPLCDQLDYVGGINSRKTKAFIAGITEWEAYASGISAIKLKSVREYVSGGTMISELEGKNIFKESEYNVKGDIKKLNNEKIRKIGVRFAVECYGDMSPNVWEDTELRKSWIDYVKSFDTTSHGDLFDYLSGIYIGQKASQHPKNVNSKTGNAKLLSCNDSTGYTYRGRFSDQDDAIIVDYEQSQKMHQTLRWLVSNFGYDSDSQTIVVWAVDSDTNPVVKPYQNSFEMLWTGMNSTKSDSDILSEAADTVYANYAVELRKLFQGYGKTGSIMHHARRICIAVFDAATTGRMGLTFYQELPQNVYLENIANWHEETSYFLTAWQKEKDEKGKDMSIPRHYLGAPSYDDIIYAVYGKAHGGKDAGYSTLKRKIRKQLLECMFGNLSLPKNMVDMAAVRASRPVTFDSEGEWNRSLNITCALARKYYKQKKEEISLALDETRSDRDYLYGRLLAIADRIEQTSMYKAGKQDNRSTNAIRLMGAFSVKPYHTWGILYQQLLPYINQLYGAGYYQSIIDDVMIMLEDNFEDNSPLSPLYLLGFSAQRRAFSSKIKQDDLEGNENDTAE